MTENKIYTVKEAAERLGLSVKRVQQFCRSNKVLKIGRDYLLYDTDLYRLQGRIGKRGDKIN